MLLLVVMPKCVIRSEEERETRGERGERSRVQRMESTLEGYENTTTTSTYLLLLLESTTTKARDDGHHVYTRPWLHGEREREREKEREKRERAGCLSRKVYLHTKKGKVWERDFFWDQGRRRRRREAIKCTQLAANEGPPFLESSLEKTFSSVD